jgi:hypothetical protein
MINGVTFYSTYDGTQRTPDVYAYNPTNTPERLSLQFTSVMLPGKFQLSGSFQGVSGPPLTVSAGFDLDGDQNTSGDRPRGLPQTVGDGDVGGQLAIINAFRANPCSFVYYPTVPCTAKAQPPIPASLLKLFPVDSLSLRLSKIIPIAEKRRAELFFEGYNMTNHVTKYGGSGTLTSAALFIRTSALDPRIFQWGARFTF